MDRLLALIWLKLAMWRHGLRTGAGVADVMAGIGLTIVAGLLSLGLTAGLGAAMYYALVAGGAGILRRGLLVVSHTVAVLAVGVPVLLGLERGGLPLSRLAVFPLSRGALYRLSLGASFASGVHLLWLPSLLFTFLLAVTWHGAGAFLWGSVLAVFGLCLMVWCNTLLLLVRRLTARRSVREVLAVVALFVLVAVSVVPAVLDSSATEERPSRMEALLELLPVAGEVMSVFPPSLAAGGLATAHFEGTAAAAGPLAWLLLWTAAGIALGFHLFAKSLREGGAPAPARPARRSSRGLPGVDRLTWLPSAVRGVAARELRYLLRSSSGRFSVASAPVFMVLVGTVFAQGAGGPVLGIDASGVLFMGAMLYAAMFSSNFVNNAFAWERGGVRSYFMTPAAPEHVVLGKNLGVWIFNTILGVVCVIVFTVVAGAPAAPTLASGCLAFTAVLIAGTVAGNFVSISFPVSRDISRVNNSPSQIGFVVSLAVLLVTGAAIAGLALTAALTGGSWTLPILLAILVAVEAGIYAALLGAAGRHLASRRERLVETLQAAL